MGNNSINFFWHGKGFPGGTRWLREGRYLLRLLTILETTRRSKIVSRATGRRSVTSVDHSRCAVVLKEIQRYHGPGLWAWRKIFSPLRGTNSTTTHCHIFLVQYPDRYHRGCCCGPFEAEQPKRY